MARMYKPRDWPYTARGERDNAAEEIAIALKLTITLADASSTTAKIVYHLSNALRHLESVGAQTRPAPPEP